MIKKITPRFKNKSNLFFYFFALSNFKQSVKKAGFIALLVLSLLSFQVGLAQNIGDFRSIATGNWTSLTSWQYFNGTAWVTPSGTAPQGYPGQFAGTGTVTIQNSNNITINTNITISFTALVIGGGVSGILTVGADVNVSTLSTIINAGGLMKFSGQNDITFPTGASIQIISPGKIDDGGTCTNNVAVYIGTVKYAVCTGSGNADFSFYQLNSGGGSLKSNPSYNSPVCDNTISLIGAYTGVINTNKSVDYKWTASGPSTVTFNSDTNASPIATINPSTYPSVYTFTLEVTNDGNRNSKTISVTVNAPPTTPTGTAAQSFCSGASPTVASLATTGTAIQWYAVSSGGVALATTTVLVNGTHYYATQTVGGCESTSRFDVTATVNTTPGAPTASATLQPTCSVATGTITVTAPTGTGMTYSINGSAYTNTTGIFTAVAAATYSVTAKSAAGCISSPTNVIINAQPSLNTWNGSLDKNWNKTANWSCGWVPTISTDVLIPFPLASGNFPTIFVGDPSGLARDIDLQSGASITIEGVTAILTGTGTGNALNIAGKLTLNGTIHLEGESQLLQDTGSTLDAASTGTIEIDQQGTGNSFRYNYWSSPVNSRGTKFTIGEVLRNGTNPITPINYGAAYAFADGAVTPQIQLSTYWMYVLRNSGAGYSAWYRVGNTGEVSVGEGYSMKGSNTSAAEQNYTFVGAPNNGDITLTLNAGFDYLVGNPYPSAIDARQFISDNPNTTGTIYFWEHYGGDTHNLAGYQGGYATRNYSGGASASAASSPPVAGISNLGASVKGMPGGYIPVGQAFFVVGNAVGGQIKFNNGQRVFVKESQLDTGNNPFSVFMKLSNTKAKNSDIDLSDLRPKFRIGFDAPKISHRQLLLTVDERATKLVDWGFDAEIYEIFADDMYWMLNNKKYVIQGTNAIGLNSEVPLGIQLSKTGVVTVKIDALENVDDDTSIYLKDKLTGETFNMRDKPVELNLALGTYTDRFVIVFKTQKLMAEDFKAETLVAAIAQPMIEGFNVFMNNAIKELQIKNNSNEEILNIALINSLGQNVKTWNSNFNFSTISLPISAATGVYLVQINTKTGKTVKKISVE